MLLKVLQRELVHKLRQFTPQGIENVLWAFATLGHHPGEILPPLLCPTAPPQDSHGCYILTVLLLCMWMKTAVCDPCIVAHCHL